MVIIFVSRVVFIILQDKIFCCFSLFSTVLFLKTEHEIKGEQTVILFYLFANFSKVYFYYLSIICFYLVNHLLYRYNIFIFDAMHTSVLEVNFYQSIQQHPIFPQCLSLKFKHDSSPPQFHPIKNNLCSSEKRRIFYPEQSSIL